MTRLWKAGDVETACGSLFHNAVEAFNRLALDAPEVRAAIEGDCRTPRVHRAPLRAYLNRQLRQPRRPGRASRPRSSRRSSEPSRSTLASWPTSWRRPRPRQAGRRDHRPALRRSPPPGRRDLPGRPAGRARARHRHARLRLLRLADRASPGHRLQAHAGRATRATTCSRSPSTP